ncbi:hypothetical protein KC19_3G145600 [Ceratodon purpureus]|uniref:DUF4110 domain-containing protein n=1 Tax=Ceratodon purpureus TaxID=3225 RepID=A0A8T0IL11_CERPU|nr:hypothetical protein KC19_3G145600 [Ceratodon purpureus]
MGKKAKKPGKGKEKTERKTAKATEKRSRREDKLVSEEDDIDAILARIQKEEAKKVAVQVDENVPAPSPRCNGSMTVNPLKDTELIFYGGEYYNGDKTFVYGDLYRYNVEKNDWKLVSSPNSPPPRSAHQAVAWKNSLFIFGGEYTSVNQEKFHHYKDLWRLDLNTNVWEQLNLKGAPSPRSGHRMVLYKHKLIIFGGFYDTLREVRYYNDLHVLDLDDYKWQEIKPKPGAAWPSPRSAFQFASYLDEIFLYGGYYKDALSEKDGSEKGVVHADMWVLDPRTFEWNKVKKLGMPPGPRAGFSMCVHKKRAILFGGVVDTEEKDIIRSTFMNEMYAFQMDNRRWFPLELRRPKVHKGKAKGQSGPAKSKKQKGNSGAMNVEDAIPVTDDDAGMEVESDDMNIRETEGLAKRIEDTIVLDDTDSGSVDPSSAPAELEPQIVKPCPRINSLMVVGRDTLYLYGGMMELGEREVTMDDLYTMDLNKLDAWNLVIEATETDWVEVGDDEDDDDDDEDDDDDDEDEDDEDDEEDDEKAGSSSLTPAEAAAALLRGEGKKLQRKDRKAEIARIRAELGLADAVRTPAPGESLKEFFARTNMYWQMAAYEHTQHTGKELRKDGFDLADGRYRELRPVLDELEKLEAEQKAIEAEEAKTLATRKGKDKAKRAAR